MKTVFALLLVCALSAGCVAVSDSGNVTTRQQTIANAVTDALSIGLVPVLGKNPSYLPAAKAVAASLGSFSGTTITPADVDAFLGKTSLADADKKAVAGVVNAAWGVYTRRYQQQVGVNLRPDVRLFLSAVADGIMAACAAVPPTG
jgi:hypothetical protein